VRRKYEQIKSVNSSKIYESGDSRWPERQPDALDIQDEEDKENPGKIGNLHLLSEMKKQKIARCRYKTEKEEI
jgi:hypothetical protein